METFIKNIKKYNKKWRNATLMDDLKFRMIAKSKGAVEEILRTILKDDKLEVIETIEQRNRSHAYFHGVILDCECRLKTKEIVNIEVQIAQNDDPIYRMRYNQSMLTVLNSLKDKDFKYKKIPKIISIMFCEFDLFKMNKPIYEIFRHVNSTSKIADNGIRELYINLKAKTKDKKLKELFKIFTTIDYNNKEIFPRLSEDKVKIINKYAEDKHMMSGLTLEIFKDGEKAGREAGKAEGIEQGIQQGIEQGMQQGIEQGMQQGIEQGMQQERERLINSLVKKGILTKEEADKELAFVK